MFSKSIPLLEDKAHVTSAAKELLLDVLADAILNNTNMPEEQKISVRICMKAHEINKTLTVFHERFGEPTPGKDAIYFETRKHVLAYLSRIETELKQFLENTNLPIEKIMY